MSGRYRFDDPRGFARVLVVSDDAIGVEHFGCSTLAEVSPELDCAYCSSCSWQCRLSGGWYVDTVNLHFGRPS